jgi:two-component system sensor histidine kinase BaeS
VIAGDADRLTQIVTNLLGNALAHTPAGGSVILDVGADEGMAVVDVADDGRGIPASEVDRIFERFYRLPGSEHRAGRGLGLTIARALARAHGGDVTAHSDGPGRGATFRLTIPLPARS